MEVVKCLLDNGANKSLTDRFGSTPEKWTKDQDIKTFIVNHHMGDKPTDSEKTKLMNNKYHIMERIGKGGFGTVGIL